MIKKLIRIHDIKDVTAFVHEANLVDGDVTLYRGKYVVDGTSLMGVMSIDVAEGVTVEFPETATNFYNFLIPFFI